MTKNKIERFHNIGDVRRFVGGLNRRNIWSPTSVSLLVFACEKLEAIERALAPQAKPKRKPTAWQRFFAKGMKAGKTPRQIGAEWRTQVGRGGN